MSGKFMLNGTEYLGGGSGGGGGNVDDVLVNGTTVVDSNKKAQIKSYKEITLQEYIALPDTKLTDGIMYAIKDATSESNNYPPLIYSDNEREVGVWRDGKPLYQKTLTGTFNNATTNQILELTNETIVKADGYLMLNDGSGNTMQLGSYLLSNYYCGWYVYSGSLYIFCSSGFANANYAIIILYTKSTDTPGSGTWNTQGGYTHHYSKTEQVVGTWIDGNTIYETSYELTSAKTLSGSWSHSNIVIDNISKVIRVVTALDADGQTIPLVIGLYSGYELALAYSGGPNNSLKYFTIQYIKSSS